MQDFVLAENKAALLIGSVGVIQHSVLAAVDLHLLRHKRIKFCNLTLAITDNLRV